MTKIYDGSSSLYIFILLLLNTYKDLFLTYKRYVDDAIVHCRTEKQAEFVKVMIEERLAEYKLKLHPEKTQIV